MNRRFFPLFVLLSILIGISCRSIPVQQIPLATKKWEPITLSFQGPATSETATDNPFLNYRLIVHFKHPSKTISIPGSQVTGGNKVAIGLPPNDINKDWVVLLKKK